MKVLILSKHGDGTGIAHKLANEGNDVDLYIQDQQFERALSGIVNRVASWRPSLNRADLVICDSVGFGKYAPLFKQRGIPAISCNEMADMVELDRDKGMELLGKVGVDIPKTIPFANPEEAKQLLEMWDGPGYVLKPSGNLETSTTAVCHAPELAEYILSTYPSDTPLIAQEIVEGVEVSTEGWFNGRDWVVPFNHTFEEKRLMEGGKGANTGCQGNVVVATKGNKLVDATVGRLTPFLRKIGYRGPIDINCIVNESGAFALEISSRPGYDAIEALMEGLKEPALDLFFEVAAGTKKEMAIDEGEKMIAVRLSIPPWPGGKPKADEAGLPIVGLNEHNLKHIYFADVYRDGDEYRYAASDGVLMKVTAHGRDVQEARNRAYRTIGNLTIPDLQYRRDIGARVDENINTLRKQGWV